MELSTANWAFARQEAGSDVPDLAGTNLAVIKFYFPKSVICLEHCRLQTRRQLDLWRPFSCGATIGVAIEWCARKANVPAWRLR